MHHGCEILVEDPVKILVDPGCENVKKLPGLTLLLSDGGASGLTSSSAAILATLVLTFAGQLGRKRIRIDAKKENLEKSKEKTKEMVCSRQGTR